MALLTCANFKPFSSAYQVMVDLIVQSRISFLNDILYFH